MTPAVVIFPILLADPSVNQRLPSAPVLMSIGPPGEGTGYSVMTPAVVIFAILFEAAASFSVNHRLPSGPAAIPPGPLPAVGIENSMTAPVKLIFPILLAKCSVNHKLPSGPAAIPYGPLPVLVIGYSVIVTWAWQTTAVSMRNAIKI